jgi:hypothetical protein
MDVREQSKLNLIEAIETKIETATDHREPIEKQDLFRLFLKYGFPAKEGQRIYDEIRAQVKRTSQLLITFTNAMYSAVCHVSPPHCRSQVHLSPSASSPLAHRR